MAAHASEQEARDVAEAARESDWEHPSFVREMFLGRFRMDLIHPHPPLDHPEERDRVDDFMAKLRDLLVRVDSDAIDREGQIPESVVQELRDIGAFGIKIPRTYGGLGLSQLAYVRAMALVTSKDGSLTALLSAHQSIGLPQPLTLFGTDAQKSAYLPRLARGAISAFALTETDAGSDPANMHTTATPSEDGSHYVLNGEKLWCTNGTCAELYVVMARTPDKVVAGKGRRQISAFIVERDMPGVEVAYRCRFMGLKAIENGVIRFTNVRVPRENILWAEGKGLKLALVTLNTGRLTLPASVAGGAKALLSVARTWSKERVQWGQAIGKHEAVAHKIGRMAAETFAMEAVAEMATALYERGNYDIRLEAAVAKMWNTERGWRIVDDTLQIRGGRGYETADSLRGRGETPIPIERAMRDFRINLIFEGSSEIMRLFIAREAVDEHFAKAFDIVRPGAPARVRIKAAIRSAPFYLMWYPARLLGLGRFRAYGGFGSLAPHLRWADRATNRLGRALFHAMVRYGPKLERRQMVLFRVVDAGAELFAMAAACARAQALGTDEARALADCFCREAKVRVTRSLRDLHGAADRELSQVARDVLAGKHTWLEQGAIAMHAAEEKLTPVEEREPAGV